LRQKLNGRRRTHIQIFKEREGERESGKKERKREKEEIGERKLTWWVQTVFRVCPSGERKMRETEI